jgi:hypothetical protein
MKPPTYSQKSFAVRKLAVLACMCLAGAVSGGLRDIVPRPQQMGSISDFPMIITGSFYLVMPNNPTLEELVVQQEVIRLFQESNLRTPIAVEYSQFTGDIPALVMGTADRFPELAVALDSTGLTELGDIQHGEEYQIFVDEFRILILGQDLRALRWGALTLIKLIGEVNGAMYISAIGLTFLSELPQQIILCVMKNRKPFIIASRTVLMLTR